VEAVKKAQQIVLKNEEMIATLNSKIYLFYLWIQ
jgi:hypothetical protein